MLDGLNSVTEWMVAIAAFLVAVGALLKWYRRGAPVGKAASELIIAQMKTNGGGSLIDKIDTMLEVQAGQAQTVEKISTVQDTNRLAQDERHLENSTRLDELERGQRDVREEMDDLRIHSQYVARVFERLPAALTSDGQAAWKIVIESARQPDQIEEEQP